MTTPSDRLIPHYRCCGSPSTGGHYFEASGKDTPIYGASDYDLAMALHGTDQGLLAGVAREWLVRNPTRPSGDKHWAQEAHTIATALEALTQDEGVTFEVWAALVAEADASEDAVATACVVGLLSEARLRGLRWWTAAPRVDARIQASGANLTRADLNGADLNGADLTNATLIGADLTNARLTNANLYRANLAHATLIGANLTGANLTRAHLTDADLTNARPTGAWLTEANLSGAKIPGANLTEAQLASARIRP